MSSRRAAATLTLVLIGTGTLSGCGKDEPQTATRDVYKTQADCKRDWGDDATKCERQSSGTHSGYYYGPSHYTSSRSGFSSTPGTTTAPRSGSSAIGSTTVSRGGFGASASSHSSGG